MDLHWCVSTRPVDSESYYGFVLKNVQIYKYCQVYLPGYDMKRQTLCTTVLPKKRLGPLVLIESMEGEEMHL